MQTAALLRAVESRIATRYPVRRDYVSLAIILLLAALLRFNGLNEPGLWLDEVYYTMAAQTPILDQIIRPTETLGDYLSADPTLSSLPFSLSLKLGYSNFLARFPAALFGILAIALIYQAGHTLFGNKVGLVAAFLLAISSFHIFYSQEGRSYAQFVFFSLASFLFLYQAISQKRSRYWLLYGMCAWAGVSTSHLMLFTVAAQGVFLVLISLRETWRLKNSPITSQFKPILYFLLLLIAVFILRTPWLEDFTRRQCPGCAIGRPSYPLDLAGSFMQSVQAFMGGNDFTTIVIILICCLFSLTLILYGFPEQGLLLGCWLVLSILATTIGLWFISQFYHPRYTIWGLPAFLLIAAFGIVYASQLIQKFLPAIHHSSFITHHSAMENICIALLLLPILALNLNQLQGHLTMKQERPRGRLQDATGLITAQASPGEAVIAIGLPATHLQFYIEQTRQDLDYFDDRIFVQQETSRTLPAGLNGRWYVLHGAYAPPKIPESWPDRLKYHLFYDIVVVHFPGACNLKDCIHDTEILLSEIAEVNPDTRLAQTAQNIASGLRVLQLD